MFKLNAFGQSWSGNTVHCIVVLTRRLRACDVGDSGTETDMRFYGTEFPETLENVGSFFPLETICVILSTVLLEFKPWWLHASSLTAGSSL